MQNYFLPFPNTQTQLKFHHKTPLVSIGSCFAEEIGKSLYTNCFNAQINPFGIVFSPELVFRQLHAILDHRVYTVEDLLLSDDLYYSFDHHGAFSGVDRHQVLMDINTAIENAHKALKMKGAVLMLTFASAYYYRLRSTGEPVANCHKQSSSLFDKVLQTDHEMIKGWPSLMERLLDFNPDLSIIATVSPVRHIKDGVVENNVSKAQLFSLLHSLANKFPKQLTYFPGYEIVNDCLRDYRFFKSDLVHPNAIAIQEIWTYFQSVFFDVSTKAIVAQIEGFNRDLNHKVLNASTKKAAQFKQNAKRQRQLFFEEHAYLQAAPYFIDFLSAYFD